MGAVILCRLPRPDAAAEERLLALAGVALPQAGAELLFIGSAQDGGEATLLALRFAEDAAAHAFRLAAASIEGLHLIAVRLRPPRVGDPSAALF